MEEYGGALPRRRYEDTPPRTSDASDSDQRRDGVIFVGVVGEDCAKIEDIIDEIVVSDGSRDYRMLTSSHPGESVEEAVTFALELTGDYEGEVHVVVV